MGKIYRLVQQSCLATLLFLGFNNSAAAQIAIVTHVSGEVWLKNTPVALRMHIGIKDTLKGKGNAEVGLLDQQRGRVLIQFKNGHRIAANRKSKPSELYQLTIGDAMEDYHTVKQATHKGTFDLNDFFSHTDEPGKPQRLLLVSGQGLPLHALQVTIDPSDRYFICPASDTNAVVLLKRTPDSLYIPQLKAGSYLLQVRYLQAGKEYRRFFLQSFQPKWLTGPQIREIARSFTDQREAYYHNDQQRMLDDIHQELFDWYGKCYMDGVDRYVPGLRQFE
ncbi:hypothetical protein [Mucilaginibacter sp. KACC 22063]|uniref:hypothetical protein n=1 Tax=Mucilaginibacter sp. KACC 22063 TaxID=3025666 RepID=UPI002366BBD2|nr:hypothetical protein [Mucilaginibacter sp. KACC 22063]WDF57212.1 hypothetical protein PQ461_09115 [Mucilaginibacter sp. KACC 22063]